jgi:hypothetical protein
MNSKKAITLLVLTTLLLSFVPVMPTQALTNPIVEDVVGGAAAGQVADGSEYYYDDTLAVTGSGVAPGLDIEVWWDGTTLLNTSTGNADGTFEVWFDVPEAVGGDHYIWVKVPSTGAFDPAPTLEATPGDEGAVMVGESIELDPDSGLKDEEVTISGYGYQDEETNIDVTFNGTSIDISPSDVETNSLGSWTATFEVPDLAYGTYTVDANGTATADFTIGASISLDISEGPAGIVVEISGRGFTADAMISDGTGTIELEGVPCEPLDDDVKVRDNADTTFTLEVVIPDVKGDIEDLDELTLYVEEGAGGAGRSAEADFALLGHPGIELSPEYGPVGSTIIVKGYNFTQIDGEDVLLELDGIGDAEVETDSDGEFEASFRIPGAADTANLTATQGTYNIAAWENFRVGFISVVVNPQSGPAGSWVSVSGSGFDNGVAWNATVDGELWLEGTASGAGVINEMAHMESLEAGIYEVLITEDGSGIQVSTEFEVTEATYVETSPMVAPAGYNVTLMGYNFAENPGADTDLDIVFFNDTDEWAVDLEWGGVNTELLLDEDWDDGYFEGNFVLEDDETLDVGMYYFNVTDEYGMFYQLMFEIVNRTVDIEPRMPIFQVGDTCGFDVETSFIYDDAYIEIYDPDGDLYWTTDPFDEDVWIGVGTIERVPYYAQVAGGNPMTFLEDAPLGEWSWMMYDPADDDEALDTGTFMLEESDDALLGQQVADLSEGLSDLSDQVSGVSDEFDSIRSEIADVASVAADAVAAAESAAEAVNAVAATANTASEAAANAAEAANAAKDAANGLTTLVYGAIGAALVAALAAIVSLMQISRRIAG